MGFDETRVQVWKAGEIAPAGTSVRIDHRSYRQVQLDVARPSLRPLMTNARYRAAPVWSGDDGQEELHMGGLHPRPESTPLEQQGLRFHQCGLNRAWSGWPTTPSAG